jgi:hypothetical protein
LIRNQEDKEMASLTGVKEKKDKNEPFTKGKDFYNGKHKNKSGNIGPDYHKAFNCFT